MNEESTHDTRLHRYFDGDLSAEEAAEVRRALDADPALRAKLDGLREVRAVVRESVAADLRAEPVPSEDLWARIEGSLDAPAGAVGAGALDAPTAARAEGLDAPAKREGDRPGLRVVDGGAPRAPAAAPSAELRRRRIAGIVVGALALAAAVLLIVLRPGEPDPGQGPVAEGSEERPLQPGEVEPAPGEQATTAAEEVARTEVLEVDFGDNSGAIFSVEGDDGERYAVVWLADVQPKPTAVE